MQPTGRPNHPEAHERALAVADLFAKEYARWLRADVPFKDDVELTAEGIAGGHLVLFGDPSSTSVLAQVAGKLPIRWTDQKIVVGHKSYPAESHLLAMIYPNPLNPERYVVINSGHTFHEEQFRGTNAFLFPRLGDYAVLRFGPGEAELEVVEAGFFDEEWGLVDQ